MTASPHILDEQAYDLPPKPKAPKGRVVLWTEVIRESVVHYHESAFLVNAAFMDVLIERHQHLTEGGYEPPLTAEHPRDFHPEEDGEPSIPALEDLVGVADKWRAGDIMSLVRWSDGNTQVLLAAVCPGMPADKVQEALDSGQLRYVSPGFGAVQMPNGEIIPFALRELSLVTRPHLKGRPTHFLGSAPDIDPIEPVEVCTMDNDKGKEPEVSKEAADEQPDMEARMAALEESMAKMVAFMADYEAKMAANQEPEDKDDDEEEGAQMSAAEPAVVKDLKARLVRLEQEKADHERALFAAHAPKGATLTLGEDDLGWLYDFKQRDPAGFKALEDRLQVPEQAAPPAPVLMNGGWSPRGTSAPVEPAAPRKLTREEIANLSDEDYIKARSEGRI